MVTFEGPQPPNQYPQQQLPPVRQGGGGYGGVPVRGAAGGTNTVIIQDRDRGGGMGDFASGMMVGAMAGGITAKKVEFISTLNLDATYPYP